LLLHREPDETGINTTTFPTQTLDWVVVLPCAVTCIHEKFERKKDMLSEGSILSSFGAGDLAHCDRHHAGDVFYVLVFSFPPNLASSAPP
jgi:hypothetical protein